ncbi:MAG: hypothetical protein Q4A32_12095, partial [Lachnospiraceae bacterium]|nr:hypothetical protein [Lachnospiraceae bacterium]
MVEKRNSHSWPYEDIVNLPHHVSQKHPPMEMLKRAAQFAPFAALTGYDDVVDEAARLTYDKAELAGESFDDMNRKLVAAIDGKQEVTVTYFRPDEKKTGGAYVSVTGRIKKIEMGELIM